MPRKLSPNGQSFPITISWGALFRVVAVFLAVLLVYWLRDLILVLATAIVIASAVQPIVRLLGKYRVPRTLAVLFIYLVAVTVLFGLVPFLILPVLIDLGLLASTLSSQLGQLSFTQFSLGPLGSFTASLGNLVPLRDALLALQGNLAGLPVESFIQFVSIVFGGLFSFVLIVVISFYLAVQKDGLESFLRLITPLDREQYVLQLWQRSQQKIGLWTQGQLLLGLIIGVLVFLGLTILQIKYALVLAVLAALFELIPYFGPVLSAVPAVLLGFAQSPTAGLMVLGLYVIIQQFENQLIYPLVVNKIVGVPSLLVILSLIIGGQLAGFLGIILAVPAAAVLMEVADDWAKRKRSRQELNGV